MSNLQQQISAILAANHSQPYAFLGMHKSDDSDHLTVTTFQPGASAVSLIDKKTGRTVNKLAEVDHSEIFTVKTRRKNRFDYQLKVKFDEAELLLEDPFAFPPVLGELDVHLLAEGTHKKPYQVMGAHLKTINDVSGVAFTVWAPNASHVAVVGEFNHWDGRKHPMRLRHDCGVWEIFIPHINAGMSYKYEIKDRHGNLLPLKSDPFASQSQIRPENASVIAPVSHYQWRDQQWLDTRGEKHQRDKAISIYEVHLGSWKRKENNEFLNYRELADDLIQYVKYMNFTHIQLMPVSEYPFDGSWGYQPVGLFAPTSRFGQSPETLIDDFKYFVDTCHQNDIGLLIDWVPGHFPVDEHGLAQFDGTHLYEHEDRRKGFHPDWNTLIYNYGRTEVANFLRASANHWLDRYHVDGVRVDAVASMLYLDYSRNEGEWEPNEYGGRENLEAVAFLKSFNESLYGEHPGTFSVAEESTSWPGVSRPTDAGGLGFGFKWNMGWMNDSLEYMSRDPIYRKHHQNEMSFSLVYAFDENFILPLSHDEVVHGKGSILGRMPGDDWQRFANLRAYYGFMWTHPGKKLLFMGCEYAQSGEWNFDQSLDWHETHQPKHAGVQTMVRDLNLLYRNTPALYEKDCEHDGFEWIDHENAEQSIFAYARFGFNRDKPIIVVSNFTPETHHNYRIGVPVAGKYKERFNSDAEIYGGSNQGNLGGVLSERVSQHHRENSVSITIPPLSTIVLELQ
ncbi:1,4-alpha-glucan branching protein GlgB [Aliikangiella marina]|uniref:1,4-alpha-glucan branching enzyme GlgB n=1 Tax=Aliikangiella marina TaxID=1712262 RepID=A0A545TCU7_9GAMM|nr:1,4-alpha-glucan branching protein GlgB [Aliikangiella marina]TQV75044.1 1,4-alpha-glucan branching protein GlgB [Aliikangiella marina]